MGTEVDATVSGSIVNHLQRLKIPSLIPTRNVSTETSITLTDVVVTSPNDRSGTFYIQENGGGEHMEFTFISRS